MTYNLLLTKATGMPGIPHLLMPIIIAAWLMPGRHVHTHAMTSAPAQLFSCDDLIMI